MTARAGREDVAHARRLQDLAHDQGHVAGGGVVVRRRQAVRRDEVRLGRAERARRGVHEAGEVRHRAGDALGDDHGRRRSRSAGGARRAGRAHCIVPARPQVRLGGRHRAGVDADRQHVVGRQSRAARSAAVSSLVVLAGGSGEGGIAGELDLAALRIDERSPRWRSRRPSSRASAAAAAAPPTSKSRARSPDIASAIRRHGHAQPPVAVAVANIR